MRIYELAKKYDCNSKEIQKILDEIQVTYKTHSSSIPDDKLQIVEEKLGLLLKTESHTSDQTQISKESKPKKEKTKSETIQKSKKNKDDDHKQNDSKKQEATQVSEEKKLIQELETEIIEKYKEKKDENVEIEIYEKVFEEIFEEEQQIKRKSAKTKQPHKAKEKTKDLDEDVKIDESIQTIKEEQLNIPTEPIKVHDGITVKELAEVTGIPASEIVKKLFLLGMMASINQNLDKDTILIVADELKIHIEVKEIEKNILEIKEEPSAEIVEEEKLEVRPPVVTIMGHVDHGKTTLLDAIRKTKVVDTESGGITQHIGAYMVEHNNLKICFLDTPGHAAFTQMRAMGANVTDIVVLVVSANDGIQPQTLESISHAKEAEVPLIIAINKIDMPNANVEKVKTDLAQIGITAEEWGGKTQFISVSALKGTGIDELLDSINIEAEMLELRANPKGKAFGIILECCQTNQLGPVATVLVKNGTLKVGDSVVCGHVYGKIRRIENDLGKSVNFASPSMPVKVYGFSEVPEVAGRVKVYSSDKEAKEVSKREEELRRSNILNKRDVITLENLYSSIQAETKKEFKIILKADVLGSIAAINALLSSITSEKVKLKIIHSATGAVTDTDVMLAQAYNAMIFTFHAKISPTSLTLAKKHNVKIGEYTIIYKLYEDVVKAMEGLLDFDTKETYLGNCIVKKVFRITKVGAIAGCLVTEGKILRSAICRIKRAGVLLDITTKISSLKHYKDEVSEVKMGTECGVGLEKFSDFLENDILEFYSVEKMASSL